MMDKLNPAWKAIGYTVDILFLADIFVNFNVATYDEDMEVVEDRLTLAKNYLKSWFLIDFVTIIPFELLSSGGESSKIVRMSRIGRIYKILKLLKLIRFFKL